MLTCFSLNAALSPLAAWADVPTPPTAYHKQIDTSFPSGQALLNQGYNPKTGVLKVENRPQGKPTVTTNGQTVTGTRNTNVVVTDKYGNKVKVPSRITQTANAAVIASYVGNSLAEGISKYGNQSVNDYKDGRFGDMGRSVAGGVATTLDALSGGVLGSVWGVVDNATGSNITGGNPSSVSNTIKKLQESADNFHKEMYGGGNPSSPSYNKGNPSSPSTANPSSPSTGTPARPGNPSNPSVSGGASSSGLGSAAAAAASAQKTAERNGDVGNAVGNAALKKAADTAANAAEAKARHEQAKEAAKKGNEVYQVVLNYTDYGVEPVRSKYKRLGAYTDKQSTSIARYDSKGRRTIIKSSFLDSYLPGSLKGSGVAAVNTDLVSVNTPEPTPPTAEDMNLSGGEVEQILRRMFENQQTNHREMMNQLVRIAANTAPTAPTDSPPPTQTDGTGKQVIRKSVVDEATTSKSVQKNTVKSAPYTPMGSNQAQQTEVTVNNDGSVTTRIIPRPDLKANSSQAPTRSPVTPDAANPSNPAVADAANPSQTVPNQTGNQQNQQNQQNNQQNPQQRDFCERNPQAAQCADLGSADYEDLDIPENGIDLELKPLDVFSTDGVCPENVSF
ncbi:hypothetical protein [Neisseria musculi]|uniref:hypothetical protein n=1 Tax=Neisseria musculi TaxID=1815583 RepID=UPI00164B7553|nr:hypothetical protein [Neisseria musculi]